MKSIKWGIIGCGDVTELKSGPAFNLVSNSSLVAVMRRDATKAEDYAKRHKVPKWYSNSDNLINDAEVNAIYIATPPNAHAELSIKALKAGKPVYVEKPMALNYGECSQMIEASEKYKTPLYVAYYRRALPSFLKVKELIDSNVIGQIKLVNLKLHKSFSKNELKGDMPWRVDPKIAGGGHFFDLASHQMDYMDFLFGSVQEVKSFAANQTGKYRTEDMVSASFLMPNQVLINGTWCFSVPEFLQEDVIEIIGEKGRIVFSCFDFVPVKLELESKKESFRFEKPKHVQQDMIAWVVQDILSENGLNTNAVASARTSWVLDEVVKDYYQR